MDGVALITGGASGIGAATARAFVAKGIRRIALADRNVELLAAMEAELKALGTNGHSIDVKTIVVDTADSQSVKDMVAAAVTAFGRIDHAVNCAGVAGRAPLSECSDEEWDRVVNVNERGVFFCVREEIAQMLKQDVVPAAEGRDPRRSQRGTIVNTSSVLGLRGSAGIGSYVTSKHALVGLVKTACMEYAQMGIRTNNVAPGFIETPMTMNENARKLLEMATRPEKTPMARGAVPAEVADVIVFLSSQEASFVNGVTWNVDGGYMCT